MFYHLFSPLADSNIFFNVFKYLTFRSVAAFVTALVFSFFIGPILIKFLKEKKAIESINDVVPDSHKAKAGTPTMGGLIILSGLLVSSILWNKLTNPYILVMYLTTIFLGAVGFLDDYLKNFRDKKDGLAARYKLYGQVGLGLVVALILYFNKADASITRLSIPFLKSVTLDLKIFFIPFVVFMITGTSNAVNLTDGLDGLAGGLIAIASFAVGIMAYIKGHFGLAEYLNLEFISQAGELTVFTAAMIGTLMGFLWFNTKPAQIFMGDTGSLALGGILSVLSILLREEIFFAIVGGIFVVEALSSMIQRYYFKYTRLKTGTGKRFFKRAPIHHHFELLGMKEEKIVVRFWIVGILLAALALGTIKIR
jgi:phospho-N-acetylmuramoyl-pentapeptide-transferase